MMASLQHRQEPRSRLFSTSAMNNFQTLDIHHYVLLFDDPHVETLEGDCVRLRGPRDACVELSNLSFEIAPRARPLSPAVTAAIRDAVEGAYAGYIRHTVTAAAERVLGVASLGNSSIHCSTSAGRSTRPRQLARRRRACLRVRDAPHRPLRRRDRRSDARPPTGPDEGPDAVCVSCRWRWRLCMISGAPLSTEDRSRRASSSDSHRRPSPAASACRSQAASGG